MDVLFERCCGLDVHKKLVVACVIITPPNGEPERTVHSFGTMTEDLLKLADWLEACGAPRVAAWQFRARACATRAARAWSAIEQGWCASALR